MGGGSESFAPTKKLPCFEMYDHDPALTPEVALVTRVPFSVR
jgi:hypothetical protein